MIKTITRIDETGGGVIDAAMLEQAGLKVGDEVNVEVQAGGKITITAAASAAIEASMAAATARRLIQKNSELFRRLS